MVVEHLAVVAEHDLRQGERAPRVAGQQHALRQGGDGAEVDGLRDVRHGRRGYGPTV
jgi:hypothetical protein